MEKKLFAVHFQNNPEKQSLRNQLLESHLAFVKQHVGIIISAGSITPVSDGETGGLWIMWGSDEAEIRGVFEQDPFWIGGLRAGARIYEWKLALENGKFIM